MRSLKVLARGSPLSRAQVKEVEEELRRFAPDILFEPSWVETEGDRALHISLKEKEKSDFFTREIDALLLSGAADLAVHSAKDLPDPLPRGLALIALTRGVDSADVLVMRQGERLESLPQGARIGTSSARRESVVEQLREGLRFVDIRGTIEARLAQLDQGSVDGVVMAEAALIRLGLTSRNRIRLSSPSAALQGQLAVVARAEDEAMRALFLSIDVRRS